MANKYNNNSTSVTHEAIDGPSHAGQFGWEKINETIAVPVIVRSSGLRYSPVRIVEQEIIKKYDILPQTIFQCITLRSFYLTAAEAKLLNIINFNHCDNHYGEPFFSTKDVIISAQDVKEIQRFLEVSRRIFQGEKLSPKFGAVTISIDPHIGKTINVPYIGKLVENKLSRYVPAPFVDQYVINVKSKANTTDWDLMYLKMLCIYCDTNYTCLLNRDVYIIPLEGMCYKKTNTPLIFQDFAPPNSYNNQGITGN